MWIDTLELENLRCFPNEMLNFSKSLNVIVGKNNCGKSTLIKSLAAPQYGGLQQSDVRKGTTQGHVVVRFSETQGYFNGAALPHNKNSYTQKFPGGSSFQHNQGGMPATEPQNFIYPFFSHRKVTAFSEDIREAQAISVSTNLQGLTAKLAMISTPTHPHYQTYKDTCETLLGFMVANIPSNNGQQPGIYITHNERIPLTAMGDGISLLVGFLVNLIIAENKLFLIEEPENDIHPSALKSLLNLIIQSSAKNQFIISTHSNIVVKTLGSEKDSKVFSIATTLGQPGNPQTSRTIEVKTTEERRIVLEDLGYEYYDEDSFNGWIFFEESSAEKIVRDFLIPHFAPKLNGKLRTFSCRSVTKIKSRFDEFNGLFSFLNLEPKYKNKAWVIIDAGEDESKILTQLKESYVTKNGWSADNFIQASQHDFEKYYPENFQVKVIAIEAEQNKELKRNAKTQLLAEVLSWIDGNKEDAIKGFEKSGAEVIDMLRKIEQSF